MIVCDLYIYPIKSCQGIRQEKAEVTPKGFAGDREFMLVDHRGKFLSQRQYPRLATIQVKIVENGFLLSTNNYSEKLQFKPTYTGPETAVEIWRDRTIGIDQGDEVAQWFQSALELPSDFPCRLVRQSSHHLRPIDKNYTEGEKLPVSFADGYPFLLTATASLELLNQRLREENDSQSKAIPMNRFRPNIVIQTDRPFIEGQWRSIQIGEVEFSLVKPCSRCIVTTTDQLTGRRKDGKEPLKTLSTFRQFAGGIMFGENMIPNRMGVVPVQARVKILTVKGLSEAKAI